MAMDMDLRRIGTDELVDMGRQVRAWKPWVPLPHQVPPAGDWRLWLMVAGRGSGKTDAAAAYVDDWMSNHPGHRLQIIAPTLGDAVESCVLGPSGLLSHNPAVKFVSGIGGTYVRWPNGSEGKLFGAHTPDDVERLRAGGNRHLAWYEELAAWRRLKEALEHSDFGLRLGERPHAVASTTPKPRKRLIQLMSEPGTVVTRGTTDDNPHLEAHVRQRLYDTYGGTRIGRQELEGEVLTDIPGALWTWDRIEALRVDAAPDLARIVVAVDPAVTASEDSDETGIIVVGLGVDRQGYVLDDLSCRLSPDGWGRRVVTGYHERSADRVVAEVNQGGDLVEHLIRTVDPRVAYDSVRASRGKRTRAEPVAALYEQGKVHHVGAFEGLEDQMTAFVADGGDEGDDRVDALVWGLTYLMLNAPAPAEYVVEVEGGYTISDF
jgi:predicted phage terminase large subunit-like protein